ncbi:MAG TPA: aldo/keto reductase family protein [Mycobacteriales bacterium]|nr:aldo/keto reductase family protein [Mycobacteriales bacterium]
MTYGGSVGRDTTAACVRRAFDQGVTLFDTANEYQGGKAEAVLGDAVRALPRDAVVLATKAYFPMGDRPTQRGLSRKHLFEQAGASLRRLRTDHIDLYQCHRYDTATPLAETCRAMDDLVRSGAVLYWGVSEWTADQIADAASLCRAHGWAEPVSNQPQYSALWRRVETDVLGTSAEHGLGTLAWSPLAMGVLTGKYRPGSAPPTDSRAAGSGASFIQRYFRPGVLEAVEAATKVAAETGVPLARLALAWCLRRAEVCSVLVGASQPRQVDENVAAADFDPPMEVIARFDEVLAPVALS